MSSTTSKKRKADEFDQSYGSDADRRPHNTAETAEPSSPPHLPASCLAAVLNFLPYTDVRRCMLAGKVMAKDAAGQVDTLNIMNPSELNARAARRFSNVSELNVLCLVSFPEGGDDQVLSAPAATRVIPFMISLQTLEKVFLGGLFWDEYERVWYEEIYMADECVAPNDHQAVFRSLLENLCGAFQAKMLCSDMAMRGFDFYNQLQCTGDESPLSIPGRSCRCCRNIIASFPPQIILKLIPRHRLQFCLSIPSSLGVFLQRGDSEEVLLSAAGRKMIISILNRAIHSHTVIGDTSVERYFIKRMKEKRAIEYGQGPWYGPCLYVHYLDPEMREALSLLPKETIRSIPKSEFPGPTFSLLVSPMFYDRSNDDRKRIVLRQTFDAVAALGVNLDPNDYILVDLEKEPALAELKSELEQQEAEN